jgi:hypothetical protein
MKKQICHVRKIEGILQEELNMTVEGLPGKGAHVGLIRCYHLRVDPDLGVRTAVLRCIPCACAACEQYRYRKRPWKSGVEPKDQPCFEHNWACKY